MKKLEVKNKSQIHGRGLFACEDIKKGERVQFVTGNVVYKIAKSKEDTHDMATWYGISKSKWIDPGSTIFAFLNHSCEPNCAIVGTKTLISIKNIKAGEEISIDYSMTDSDPFWEMNCLCGSRKCRGTIKSIQFLPKKTFDSHMPNIPRYFQKLYFSKKM